MRHVMITFWVWVVLLGFLTLYKDYVNAKYQEVEWALDVSTVADMSKLR